MDNNLLKQIVGLGAIAFALYLLFKKPKKAGHHGHAGHSKSKENNPKKDGHDGRSLTKAEAGRLGGIATAEKGPHKGHKSTKGLAMDMATGSKEPWEQRYMREHPAAHKRKKRKRGRPKKQKNTNKENNPTKKKRGRPKKLTKEQQEIVKEKMQEYAEGKCGKDVSREQAVAIAIQEAKEKTQ